jgi:hypothetical protein
VRGSDITDVQFLTAMHEVLGGQRYTTLARWDLRPYFPDMPDKVILSKARKLIKRGLINGCDCGCRGDFGILDKGRALLETDLQL